MLLHPWVGNALTSLCRLCLRPWVHFNLYPLVLWPCILRQAILCIFGQVMPLGRLCPWVGYALGQVMPLGRLCPWVGYALGQVMPLGRSCPCFLVWSMPCINGQVMTCIYGQVTAFYLWVDSGLTSLCRVYPCFLAQPMLCILYQGISCLLGQTVTLLQKIGWILTLFSNNGPGWDSNTRNCLISPNPRSQGKCSYWSLRFLDHVALNVASVNALLDVVGSPVCLHNAKFYIFEFQRGKRKYKFATFC